MERKLYFLFSFSVNVDCWLSNTSELLANPFPVALKWKPAGMNLTVQEMATKSFNFFSCQDVVVVIPTFQGQRACLW